MASSSQAVTKLFVFHGEIKEKLGMDTMMFELEPGMSFDDVHKTIAGMIRAKDGRFRTAVKLKDGQKNIETVEQIRAAKYVSDFKLEPHMVLVTKEDEQFRKMMASVEGTEPEEVVKVKTAKGKGEEQVP